MAGKDWYVVEKQPHSISWIQEPMVKSFLVEGERDVAVLDTGMGVGGFARVVAQASERDPLVVQTHGHWDHVGASADFERVLIHPADADALRAGVEHSKMQVAIARFQDAEWEFPPEYDPASVQIVGTEPTGHLADGMQIDLGGRVLEVYATPGHSPGGVSLLAREARALFTGDTVNLTRTLLNLKGGDPHAYRQSLARIVELSADADIIYVCHGDPITPAQLADYHAAYESLWSSPPEPTRETQRIGIEDVTSDTYTVGTYNFLVPAGTFGSD